MQQESETNSLLMQEEELFSPVHRLEVGNLATIEHVNKQHANVRQKVSDLQEHMSRSMLEAQAFENNYYNAKHPRTKQAEEFLRRINEEKQQMKRKFQQGRKRQEQQKRRKEEAAALAAQADHAREQKRKKEEAEARQRLRQQIAEQKKRKEQEYQKFMERQAEDRVSIAERERRFQQEFEMPEEMRRQVAKLRIREERQPIDPAELNQHEAQYLFGRAEDQQRRQFERKLMRGQEESPEYYKGKYRYLVLQDMYSKKAELAQDPKEHERLKRYKQLDYSNRVRQQHAPRVDLRKRLEVELHKRETLDHRQRKADSLRPYRVGEGDSEVRYSGAQSLSVDASHAEGDHRLDGLRNLQQLHQRMRGYRQRGLIKKQKIETLTPQPRRNYLAELRRQHLTDATASEKIGRKLERCELEEPRDFLRMKLEANLIDEKARRKERVVKNAGNLPPEEALELKKSIDDEYVASIIAKISLLNVDKLDASDA